MGGEVKLFDILTALFVGFLLLVPNSAFAQDRDEARELNNRAIEFYDAGAYSDAIPLAQRSLAIREPASAASTLHDRKRPPQARCSTLVTAV
jgi:hypothetical protein